MVRPNTGKCPLGRVYCWHDRKQVCMQYHGTTKQIVEPYNGPVTILCAAKKRKVKP